MRKDPQIQVHTIPESPPAEAERVGKGEKAWILIVIGISPSQSLIFSDTFQSRSRPNPSA